MTLVKLYRERPKVSYLTYPNFENIAHPLLEEAVIADLAHLAIRHRSYRIHDNPPILHRKELFVSHEHPLRERFARLSQREEQLGLLLHTSRIGTRAGWHSVLESHGLTVRGHRVVEL